MKTVRVQNVTYYVETEDELIDLAHRLAHEGYTITQIAQFLNVSEKKVKRYMEDCW
jgi:DNA-binding NarL/FixJ family response regulator